MTLKLGKSSCGILLREGKLNVTAKTATSEDGAGHRIIIKYCIERGMTPGQTKNKLNHLKLIITCAEFLSLYKWHKLFSTRQRDSGTKI